ncbi:hypothetical protein MPSEU_000174500 [Mayamaea pseudoterrestris]|nr:hypothetical protein MPSEU_000174500 [Mayamaea pseudoterrestris]
MLKLLLLASLVVSNAFSITANSRAPVSSRSRLWIAPSSSSSTTTQTSSTEPSATLSLFSPCKVNLFLRILRKRPDGYHDLASLFQAVGFGDTLELSILTDKDVNCDTGIQTYFYAKLIKQVPAQAGLGGGSANAATALWGANQLLQQPATLDQLVEWSGALGSDITFFLSGGTAYCTGRGEVITPMDPLSSSRGTATKVYLVKPSKIGLSTPAVFQALDYNELSDMDPDEMLLPAFAQDLAQVDNRFFVNDLEAPAFRVAPALANIKQALLQHGFDHVLMSGSGSTIFCLGEPKDASAFQHEFVVKDNKHGVDVFVSKFINRPEGEWYKQV